MAKIEKSKVAWRAELAPEVFSITRDHGTEPPFTGRYWDHHEEGLYHCACCGEPLFASADKFDSGSGWPSYTCPLPAAALDEHIDRSNGMVRTEVLCGRCDAHNQQDHRNFNQAESFIVHESTCFLKASCL